jgi:ribosomal protein S20
MEVPTYQRRVGIPGSVPYGRASLGIATAQGEAVSQLGAVVSAEAERHLEARRVNELSQRTLDAVKELDELDRWAENEPAFESIVPGYEEKLRELRNKQREITDPAVKNLYARQFEQLAIRGLSKAKDVARKKEITHNQSMVQVRLNEYSDMIGAAGDFQKAAEYMKFAQVEIAGAVAAGTIDELQAVNMEKQFRDRTLVSFVRRDMLNHPKETYLNLEAGKYEGLDEIEKTGLLKEAKSMTEAFEAREIADAERIDRHARQALKDRQEEVYGELLVMKSNGQLNEPIVQILIRNRRLDPDKAKVLLDELRAEARGEKTLNDPMFVGDLASRIELGEDVSESLAAGVKSGRIKTETYIALQKQQSDRDYQRGSSYINYALKPSEADQWTPDKHIRHAEAVDEYSSRVAAGEAPMAVARNIVDRHTDEVRRTFRGLPAPRFLTGDKRNRQDLNAAREKTVQAFRKGLLTEEEFNREAERLEQLINLVTKMEEQKNRDIEDGESDRLKQAREKNK